MENLVNEPAFSYNRYYTEDEYLDMEWENGTRFEYWDGQLLAMAGGSINHSRIFTNLIVSIDKNVRKLGCNTYGPGTSLKIAEANSIFLPDLMISCNEHDKDALKYLTSPTVIIEILSDSTEIYDRNQKWDHYRKIKSLRHYILVSQYKLKVEIFSRTGEYGLYHYQVFVGLESVISIPDPGIELSLRDIYDGLKLPADGAAESQKDA